MNKLTRYILDELQWCSFFANDITFVDETREGTSTKVNRENF